MKPLVALAAVLLPCLAFAQTAAEDPNPPQCPPLTAGEVEHARKHLTSEGRVWSEIAAVAGVDALGRFLMAVDTDRNDGADELILFTPRQRLAGPWTEKIERGRLETTNGTLRFEAVDRTLAVALAVEPADVPALTGKEGSFERVVTASGFELVRNRVDPANARPLGSYSHDSPASWPESFAEDLVVPNTTFGDTCPNCIGATCRSGGCNAVSCRAFCDGLVVNDECTADCQPARSFACCNCTNGPFFPVAACRCPGCRSGTRELF